MFESKMGHEMDKCKVGPLCEICEAYELGYIDGKARGYAEVELILDAEHPRGCECEPRGVVRKVKGHLMASFAGFTR